MNFFGTLQVYELIEAKQFTKKSFIRFLCVRSKLKYPGWEWGEAADCYEITFWFGKGQKFFYEGRALPHPDIIGSRAST
jgi:hypothetical protein